MEYKSSKKNDQYFWRENFEEFKKEDVQKYDYGIKNYNFNSNLYDKLILSMLDSILSALPPCSKILDAGGGTGKWSIYFAQRGFSVDLLDISDAMLEFAANEIESNNLRKKINVIKGSICDLPFSDNSFDFVFCERNPISHCGKKEMSYQSVTEMYRVLKPSGFFWGCVLNRIRKVAQLVMELDFKRAQELLEYGTLPRSLNEYTYYYFENEYMNLLKQTGFHDIHIYPTTSMAELIPSAWLLGNEPLNELLIIEKKVRNIDEAKNYGVRFHAIAQK